MLFVLKNNQQVVSCKQYYDKKCSGALSAGFFCTQTFSVIKKGNTAETVFEIKYKNVHDAISYILYTRTTDVKFGPKILFMNLAPTCAFYFCFECRVFLYDSSTLCAYTDQLAGHMAVFTSKSPCSMYKLGLAAASSFRLKSCIQQTLCLTSGTALTHWVQILHRDPRGCTAVPVFCPSDDNGALMDPTVLQGLSKKNPVEIKICCMQNPLFSGTGKEGLL